MAGNDETVLLRPARRRRLGAAIAAALAICAVAVGASCYAVRAPAPPTPPLASPAALTVPAPPARDSEPFADEAELREHDPAVLGVFRFAPNPAILVLDFPELATQGAMLNRIAAWAEKAGQPRDRVLGDAELAASIHASGATPDTYYYGHDYRGSDIVRFFALADRDHVALRPEEEQLRRLMKTAGDEPFGFGALITVPRAHPQTRIDAGSRATILHHELAHGEYFTNAAYASYVALVWQTVLTADERAKVRAYLRRDGYDPALEDLMINEMQAYLIHTPDPRFFNERALGIPQARLAAIRQAFAAGMPSCWLRAETPGASPRLRSQPGRRPPARRQGRVSITTAVAARPPPARRRASAAA